MQRWYILPTNLSRAPRSCPTNANPCMRHLKLPCHSFPAGAQPVKIHIAAATSREDGYFCPLLCWASYSTPTPCGRLVHSCNTGQEFFGFLMTNSGPMDGPACASAAGKVVVTSSMLITTASKASYWERCCAMATGICKVDLST